MNTRERGNIELMKLEQERFTLQRQYDKIADGLPSTLEAARMTGNLLELLETQGARLSGLNREIKQREREIKRLTFIMVGDRTEGEK